MRTHRRRGLRLLSATALLAIVAAACSSSAPSTPADAPDPGWVHGPPELRAGGPPGSATPNIVFVLTDDLSWNLVKYMPHVVAMEHAGVTFRRYFVADSLCCPSRTSIFTGELPHNNGVFSNSGPDGGFRAFLAHHDQDRSFASVLQSRGYETGMFGKYINLYQPTHSYFDHRPYDPPGWSAWDVPDEHGYDEYGYAMASGHHIDDYGSDPSDYLTSVLSTKASQFISASARAHRPFMAEIATYSPHGPFVPAPADVGRFPDLMAPRSPAFGQTVQNAPAWLRKIPPLTKTDTRHFNRVFRRRAEAVQSVDRMIGRLEAQLQRLGVADNTYLVFSSDNGLHLGEYNLRQGKGTAFDTDSKVPLVVTGPGIPAGLNASQLAENIDLAPTFESLAGATPPSNIDGHSLVAQLHGQLSSDWRSAVLFEHHGPTLAPSDPDLPVPYAGNPPSYEAIRTARYLYVEYVTGERELYDLSADPYELDNRYRMSSPALRTLLHDALKRMEMCQGSRSCWTAQHLRPGAP